MHKGKIGAGLSTTPTSSGVVIVGGGFAGMTTAKSLINEGLPPSSITIVNACAFVESNVFMGYFFSRPEQYEQLANTKKGAVHTLDHVSIPGVQYAVGEVTAFDDSRITFRDGGSLPFSVLIAAVGIEYPVLSPSFGDALDSRTAFLKEAAAKVSSAKALLIGGAGPVALEVAATFRKMNENATITLVTSDLRVFPYWHNGAVRAIDAELRRLRIDVVPNEKMVNATPSLESGRFRLSSGREIEADVYLPFFGMARTSFIQACAPSAVESSRVKINDFGQSVVKPYLFAVGCANKYKVAIRPAMEAEAKVVAKNVMSFLGGAELAATLPEKPPGPPGVMWVHTGLGDHTIMNLEPAGAFPAMCGFCCGVGNPLCPCCVCCGVCCSHPAGSLLGKAMAAMLVGNPGKPHSHVAARPPHIVTPDSAAPVSPSMARLE